MRLRVVSYNVRSLRDDRAAVVRTLRALDPDVACIQETPRVLRWRSKCAALARESGLLYVAGGATTGAVAILSALRVDVSAATEYRLSHTPGLFQRGCVAARVSVGRESCVVASFHLGLDAPERARHRRELTGLVDRYGDSVAIIGGDVNERPGGPVWTQITKDFADPATTVGGNYATYPAWQPVDRIDGVFVRGPARVLNYRVVDDGDTRMASDHLPVVADIDVNPDQE
ncbi:MAG TPA: endonuclease/exonuclease/phosphatase family protein [Jiangellaceae bacterium]